MLREIEAAVSSKQKLPDEERLLRALPEMFAFLESLAEPDRRPVRSVVTTLTRGMELDLTHFPAEDPGQLAALPDAAALDRYTYFVAGCVGEFWTEMTMTHTRAMREWDVAGRTALGVRFGKALQFTNVLRDVPRDLRIGRCYLPSAELERAGLKPEDLLDPANSARAKPVLCGQLRVALEHYAAAEEYMLAIPRHCLRLRLAVLWPVLIGLNTLALLAREPRWLDPQVTCRADQGWVYWMLAVSPFCVFSDSVLHWWVGRWRRKVESGLVIEGK